ncbi:MAG TPA: DUF885 family protein, partial [Bryobacteraceae bacterium]|nr:DUF885 family protein [Bryobacteraceae bacterium]
MRTLLVVLLASLCAASCSHRTSPADFSKMTEEFVYTTLSFSPVFASGQGLHEYNKVVFDTELDNVSNQAIQKQRNFLTDFHKRLEALDKNSLAPEDRADYDIMDTQVGLSLFDIDIARSYQHSPQSYVELLGTALYNPLLLDYAPKEKRFGDIIARMKQVPEFITTAQRQLRAMPDIWVKVAIDENNGNVDLIDKTLRAEVPPSLKDQYDTAATPAMDALRAFNTFLKSREGRPENPNDPGSDWRLGTERYPTKFRLALATDRTPDQVLADAEARLKAVRAEMLNLSLPLHAKWFPTHKDHADQTGETRENTVISEVLNHIAQDHSTPASYMD